MPLHVSSKCAHHQEVKIVLQSLWYNHTYRCDDTRGCVMQFLPPDDAHMCSKHVEVCNKLIVKQKFCASSWLITEINILRRTVGETSNFLCYSCNTWAAQIRRTKIQTPYSTALPQKPTVAHPVKQPPTFQSAQRINTVLNTGAQWNPSSARYIQVLTHTTHTHTHHTHIHTPHIHTPHTHTYTIWPKI